MVNVPTFKFHSYTNYSFASRENTCTKERVRSTDGQGTNAQIDGRMAGLADLKTHSPPASNLRLRRENVTHRPVTGQ